jgi:hypothetical protein
MLGSDEPIDLDGEALATVLDRPGLLEDLDGTVDAPVSGRDGWARLLDSLVVLSDEQARRFAGDGPIITDDRPLTEYFLLRSLAGPPSPQMSPTLLRAAVDLLGSTR